MLLQLSLCMLAGGAETVRASLRTSGGFLQAATPGGCSLHLAPHDVNLVIIGEQPY